MANILTGVTLPAAPFPFETGGGAVLPNTALPRQRILFRGNASAIAAKIATNTGTVRLTATLPPNFAYTVDYVYASVTFATNATDADHYSDVGNVRITLGDGQGARESQMFSRGLLPDDLNAGSSKIWSPINIYSPPIFNTVGAATNIIIELWDTDAVNATVAGVVSCLVSVLQFDIAQVYNVALNYPLPVTIR